MNQGQFFLFIIALFPLFACISLRFFRNYPNFYNFVYYLLPVAFLVNLFKATHYFRRDIYELTLYEAMDKVSLAFYVDKISILFLFILAVLWLVFAFYSLRYFQISFEKNSTRIREYFVLIVSLVNFLILSKNLFTILFFYIYLIISSHFFTNKHFNLRESKFTKLFTWVLYCESFLIFVATILTFKMNHNIDFVNQVVLPNNYHEIYHLIVFALFFCGLFLMMIVPFYLLFKNIKFSSLTLMIVFLLSYALPSIFMFLKIINYIYGIKGLALFSKKYGLIVFELIILVNLLISSYKYLRERELKTALFYLFVSQFGVLILSILIHLTHRFNYSFIAFIAFIINFMLVFLMSANLELFLSKIHNKNLQKNLTGIFYKMPISSMIFFYGLFSLIGLSPSLSALEKIAMMPHLLKNDYQLAFWVFLLNFILVMIFILKELYIFFDKKTPYDEDEDENIIARFNEIAKTIDNDSNLILTGLLVAIAGIVFLFFNNIFMIL